MWTSSTPTSQLPCYCLLTGTKRFGDTNEPWRRPVEPVSALDTKLAGHDERDGIPVSKELIGVGQYLTDRGTGRLALERHYDGTPSHCSPAIPLVAGAAIDCRRPASPDGCLGYGRYPFGMHRL